VAHSPSEKRLPSQWRTSWVDQLHLFSASKYGHSEVQAVRPDAQRPFLLETGDGQNKLDKLEFDVLILAAAFDKSGIILELSSQIMRYLVPQRGGWHTAVFRSVYQFHPTFFAHASDFKSPTKVYLLRLQRSVIGHLEHTSLGTFPWYDQLVTR
jgi:hypothetical protein